MMRMTRALLHSTPQLNSHFTAWDPTPEIISNLHLLSHASRFNQCIKATLGWALFKKVATISRSNFGLWKESSLTF